MNDLEPGKFACGVPKVEHFHHVPILVDLVVHQDRTVQKLADLSPLPDGVAHAGKTTQ